MSYDSNNIFAKILRGEAPCVPVYEDATTLAFMDLMPQAEGHVLVLPREAAATLPELSDAAARDCIAVVQKLATAIQAATQADGVFVGQFNGAAAGQTVPHVHFHIVPRHAGRGLREHGAVRAETADLQAVADRIKARLAV